MQTADGLAPVYRVKLANVKLGDVALYDLDGPVQEKTKSHFLFDPGSPIRLLKFNIPIDWTSFFAGYIFKIFRSGIQKRLSA